MGCIPKSCCDDQTYKDYVSASEKAIKDAGFDCSLECGAGSMLAPGIAALTAAVVALKLM